MAINLYNTDFPPYIVQALDDVHFIVAGGGGQARTGVPNALEVLELVPAGKKGVFTAVSNHRFSTDTDDDRNAIMNLAVRPPTADTTGLVADLAAGKGQRCQLYSLKNVEKSKDDGQSVRKRKQKKNRDEDVDSEKPESSTDYMLISAKAVQSDFGQPDAYQKVVKFIGQSKLVTGGADGFIRVWKYDDLKKVYEVKAHTKEVDDLDVSPDGSKIVTVSRDSTAYIWKSETGEKEFQLQRSQKQPPKSYRFRACRFGKVEDAKPADNGYKLFTLDVPVAMGGSKRQPCYITKWNSDKFTPDKSVSTGNDALSALALSNDGTFLGIGTMSGDVAVYIAFSLQKIKMVRAAHNIFVTGLSFVPSTVRSKEVMGNNVDTAIVSISPDNHCKLTLVQKRAEYNVIFLLVGALLLIILLLQLLTWLGFSF